LVAAELVAVVGAFEVVAGGVEDTGGIEAGGGVAGAITVTV
jgi:hypothetical protein